MVDQLFAKPVMQIAVKAGSNERTKGLEYLVWLVYLPTKMRRHPVACPSGRISRARSRRDRLPGVASIERPEEVIALSTTASESSQQFELLDSLDTFRDHVNTQILRQGKNCLHDLKRLCIVG